MLYKLSKSVVKSILFFSLVAWSKPQSLNDLFIESKKLNQSLSQEKNLENKIILLQKFEKIVSLAIKDSENKGNTKTPIEADRIYMFFLSMEPVFILTKDKITKLKCQQTAHQIEFEDLDHTRKVKEPSTEAREALLILKNFCE